MKKEETYIFTSNYEFDASNRVDVTVDFILGMKEKHPELTYDEVARRYLDDDYYIWENRKKTVEDPIVAQLVRPHILKWIKDN